VQAAYLLLACALAALGAGYYRALAPPARSAAPLLLFVAAGLALAVTALARTDVPERPSNLAGYVHGVAASASFLCATCAMLLQSWRLRGDPRWRGRFALGLAWAGACFAGMWLQVLWRAPLRGLEQKLLILLIAGWLAWAADGLRRCVGRPDCQTSNRGAA
jgi:hypothetical protein